MAEMEAKLAKTEKDLKDALMINSSISEGPALEDWQNKMQIAWLQVRASLAIASCRFPSDLLQKANADLMAKLEASTKLMDSKMEQMKNMSFAGGAVQVRAIVSNSHFFVGPLFIDVSCLLLICSCLLFC